MEYLCTHLCHRTVNTGVETTGINSKSEVVDSVSPNYEFRIEEMQDNAENNIDNSEVEPEKNTSQCCQGTRAAMP